MTDIKPEWIEKAASAAWNSEGVIKPGKNDWNSIGETFRAMERQYIAAALSAVADDIRAEAWDEGYAAGHQDARAVQPTYPAPTPNPHREQEADR